MEPEYSDWQGYWDQLTTQVAGGDAPDILQMDDVYLREYADRDSLLDLTEVDTSGLDENVVDTGRTEEGLFGITVGTNALTIAANVDLFDEAGIDLPDDTTWTWDDYYELSVELSENLEDAYGSSGATGDGMLQAWLRQHGSTLVTEEGQLGLSEDQLTEYLTLTDEMIADGGTPPIQLLSEAFDGGIEERPVSTNMTAMGSIWSNELTSVANASGSEIELLRLPSQAGTATENGVWMKPSQQLSVYAGTDHPEEAQLFIDFFVNSPEAGEILLTERGVPPNQEVLDHILDDLEGYDQRSAEFLTEIEDEVGEAEPVPPVGFSAVPDILGRYEEEVYFDRMSAEEAASGFMAEAEDVLD